MGNTALFRRELGVNIFFFIVEHAIQIFNLVII